MKTKTCERCKGTGRKNCGVVHLGIPGLCYKCDGKGVLRFAESSEVSARLTKAIESHQVELMEKAAFVKERIANTKSEILKARRESELNDIRDAYRANIKKLKEASQAKGKWVA